MIYLTNVFSDAQSSLRASQSTLGMSFLPEHTVLANGCTGDERGGGGGGDEDDGGGVFLGESRCDFGEGGRVGGVGGRVGCVGGLVGGVGGSVFRVFVVAIVVFGRPQ